MDIRSKIREVLRKEYGNFETFLEEKYENKITTSLAEGDQRDKKAWATYNQIILELKHSIKDSLRVKELQYKLTEKKNADPSRACIEVIQPIKHISPELERLYNKVRNF